MPSAPARKSRPQLHALNGERGGLSKKSGQQSRAQVKRDDDELDRMSGLDQARQGGRNTIKILVPILLVVALAGLGWLFKPQLGGGSGGVPVLLTVISNPKTRVKVVSPDPNKPPSDLGDAPLDKASGALVGDTIVLENTDICIHHEETIQFGEPYKEKIIEKIFGEGQLKIAVSPANMKGLSIWCNNQKVGNLGLPVKLYEGKHQLEIRGDGLRFPVQFEVSIEKDKMNALPKPIDLNMAIDKN